MKIEEAINLRDTQLLLINSQREGGRERERERRVGFSIVQALKGDENRNFKKGKRKMYSKNVTTKSNNKSKNFLTSLCRD